MLPIICTHRTHKWQRIIQAHLDLFLIIFLVKALAYLILTSHIEVGNAVLLFNGHILLIKHNIVQ